MRDTERITTTYSDLVLGEDENTDFELWDSDQILGQDDDDEEEFVDYDLETEGIEEEEEVFGECGTIIRSIPSAITPLASVSDWSP